MHTVGFKLGYRIPVGVLILGHPPLTCFGAHELLILKKQQQLQQKDELQMHDTTTKNDAINTIISQEQVTCSLSSGKNRGYGYPTVNSSHALAPVTKPQSHWRLEHRSRSTTYLSLSLGACNTFCTNHHQSEHQRLPPLQLYVD